MRELAVQKLFLQTQNLHYEESYRSAADTMLYKFKRTALLGATVNITDDLDGGVFAVQLTTCFIAEIVAEEKMRELDVAAGLLGTKRYTSCIYSL